MADDAPVKGLDSDESKANRMSDKRDNSADEPDKLAEHRARMRHDWSNLIDDLIEEGRKKGVFDNLPGKGKPLQLDENPYGRETEVAHNLLKKNDLKPAWITNRIALLAQIEALRNEMQNAWMRHDRAYQHAPAEGHRGALRISWDDVCQGWEAQIRDLNKHIDDFNLKRPSDNLELFKLDFEKELARIQAPRWLK
jgi:DnaJ family protein C protein 28